MAYSRKNLVGILGIRTCEEADGRYFRDIMYELASMGDLPLPQASPPATNKRERDSEDPSEAASPSTPSSGSASTPSDEPRHIAGSKRVSHSQQQQQQFQPPPQHQQQYSPILPGSSGGDAFVPVRPRTTLGDTFSLPVHTDELGRLPLHPTADPALAYGNTGWASDFGPLPPAPPPNGPPNITMQQMAPPDVNMAPQTMSMDPMFSSMVYDQVISNLSASLAPAAMMPQHYPSSVDPQRAPLPSENFEQIMQSLGSDAGSVIMPDYAENGALSMWTSAPASFE